ncbi:feruloyl-CoA synthase [Maribacter sp. CXY002]|uniref:feruloyl-CoA synthase n=1 Tax=Maribacter luteocoastalis TaxID=3407671 RepID=UPI003B676674
MDNILFTTNTSFLEVPTIAIDIEKRIENDGTVYLKSNVPLEQHPGRVTDRLLFWARQTPDAIFLAQRGDDGTWLKLTYDQVWKKIQHIGQFLLDSGASLDKPIAILSGNSLEHGLLALAAMHVGIPYAPISPAYAMKSTDYAKLRHCIDTLTPGLIFVQDGHLFEKAIQCVAPPVPVVSVQNRLPKSIFFDTVLKTKITNAISNAYDAIGAETIAKILFTSGSTGLPKGVINTHGNMTTNWQQITQTFPFFKDGGLQLMDWLPWNHTFGGNHNFGLTLYNGGTLYIDEGNPTPKGMATTIKNLHDLAPTVYFNVPKGFEELIPSLQQDDALRKLFFSRLKMFFYAGASMPQHVWDGLEDLALRTIGKKILISSGLGMTEASPSAMFNTRYGSSSGILGVPVPGLEVKLIPDEDKLEARFRGANLTPGYWRNPEATAKAFDEEGFYKTGDALKFIDNDDPNFGMLFDGRIAEDFKLNSGTWVSVGVLRSKLIAAGNGLIKDAVITGHDRSFLGALLIPDTKYCARLSGNDENIGIKDLINSKEVVTKLQNVLDTLAQQNTGSSTKIKRALWADFELSIDKGEITDKGSINQRSILSNRKTTVEKIYADGLLPGVLETNN